MNSEPESFSFQPSFLRGVSCSLQKRMDAISENEKELIEYYNKEIRGMEEQIKRKERAGK